MQYTEVSFDLLGYGSLLATVRDVLVYGLGDEGPYDSFVDSANGVKAYVPTEAFDMDFLAGVVDSVESCFATSKIQYAVTEMPDRDWNEEWEKTHQPVFVAKGGGIWVRAPFHQPRPDAAFDIVIEPKMSFGTAHHATTSMMLGLLSEIEVAGKRVLDMGCGTGVLGILAQMRGAASVLAVDVDEWAYRNAVENAERNRVKLDVMLGDASSLKGMQPFDIVLANINRNILLRDIPLYREVMEAGCNLLLSGFYETDIPAIAGRGEEQGLAVVETVVTDGWASVRMELKK